MLELVNVSKKYKKTEAVSGLSFTVEKGQVLGLVGPNGAGKSTAVGMIATLIKPDFGQIMLDGVDIIKNPAAMRKKLGYVPQDIALYETLSGLDNMKFFGKSQGVRPEALDEEILRVSGLISFDGDMLRKRVSEYSGGMKRRLNIGVALLHHPELIILDEPTAGIDMQSIELILSGIEKLREDNAAIIYVGHYMPEVERISTHLCVMENGKCIDFGEKKKLLADRGFDSLEALMKSYSGLMNGF